MKGTVLGFDDKNGTGTISGDDGNRYSFSAEDVKDDSNISSGSKVDFDIDNGSAKDIYGAVGAVDAQLIKEKSLAAGKEALSMGKDVASKAEGILNRGIIKRFIAGGFNVLTQIAAVLMPLIGFIAGGKGGVYALMGAYSRGFDIGGAIVGLIWGIVVSFIAFGLLFSILEIRDNTRATAELLSKLK